MKKAKTLKNLLGKDKKIISTKFEIEKIYNPKNNLVLSEDFILISGIGNFLQLKRSVEEYCLNNNIRIKSSFKGQDHDDFSWFSKKDGKEKYVCTEKDYHKLLPKLGPERLYIAKGMFSTAFTKKLESILDVYFNK